MKSYEPRDEGEERFGECGEPQFSVASFIRSASAFPAIRQAIHDKIHETSPR